MRLVVATLTDPLTREGGDGILEVSAGPLGALGEKKVPAAAGDTVGWVTL
jgi:hypothetical protein